MSVLFQFSSQGAYSEGEVTPPVWDDVALLPEQAQQQELGVLGPAVDPGVLEPVGDMSLKYRHRGSVSVSHTAAQKHLQADKDVIQGDVACSYNICAGLGHFHIFTCYVMKGHRTSVPMLRLMSPSYVKPTSP